MLKRPLFLLTLAFVLACGPSEGQTSGGAGPGTLSAWVAAGLVSQEDPWAEGIVGTGLLLRRLNGVKRVLMIGAHPDDEDTALLTALSRGMGVETAYLSLSRGEGGQNLIGPEMDEGLGLVRTGELLSARALDGARQYFTRAFDFGYSKTAEETFRYWPREEILRDVTWVVRTFRPQVIVSVFSGTPSDGHGHHQAAGLIAREVFEVAGDPSLFPEQIAAGAPPWSPTKLYRLSRRGPQEGSTAIETGAFDPLLGRSYLQVAMEGRSKHRSQDMGVAQPMGPRQSRLALVESRGEIDGPDEIFAGVDTALVSLAEGLPEGVRREVMGRLVEYREAIEEAREALDVVKPWEAAPSLGRALSALRGAEDALGAFRPSGPGDSGPSELGRFLQERISLVDEALLRAAGVVIDVRVDDDLLVPGEMVDGVVELWNGGPFALRSASGMLAVPEGWRVSGELGGTEDVSPGSLAQWRFRLEVPVTAEASRAYFLEGPRDGELYRWPEDMTLWGEAANPDLLHAHVNFELSDLGEVEAWKPARFRGVDKATGEFVKPVQVVPALSVSLDPPVMVWPMGGEGPREFTVTILSGTVEEMAGTVGLRIPEGWQVDPQAYPFSLPEAGAEATFSFKVTRPSGSAGGEYSVAARVRAENGRDYQDGVSLVDYPHIRRGALFPTAESRVSVFPVTLADGTRVGYVMGAGDGGAEAARQMGAEVELLAPEALKAADLRSFDVVVLGIRAYETRPDLGVANDRLLDFVRGGGTLIVQYNKYEYPSGGFAPYRVGISRPHDRVSDEAAPVRILDPSHPLFRVPNPIGSIDFQGWVQERGLYFLGSWGPEFTPLLEMADPGEEPKRGGLVVARLGDGVYVYTGLAFFRQFPEGVPGAYRLFANLLSLRGGDLN